MSNLHKIRARYRTLLLFAALCVAAAGLHFRYKTYVDAFMWHRTHGNNITVGRYKAIISPLWWQVDYDQYQTYLLQRASPDGISQITIRPAPLGLVSDNNQKEFESIQNYVNSRSKGIFLAKPSSAQVVTLNTETMTFYCAREDRIVTSLSCHVAGVQYVFDYAGNAGYEKEAETIIATLEKSR